MCILCIVYVLLLTIPCVCSVHRVYQREKITCMCLRCCCLFSFYFPSKNFVCYMLTGVQYSPIIVCMFMCKGDTCFLLCTFCLVLLSKQNRTLLCCVYEMYVSQVQKGCACVKHLFGSIKLL